MTNSSFCLLWAFPPPRLRGSSEVPLAPVFREWRLGGSARLSRFGLGAAFGGLAPSCGLLRHVRSRVVELSNLIAAEPTAEGAGHAAPRRRPAHRPAPARHRPLSAASHPGSCLPVPQSRWESGG